MLNPRRDWLTVTYFDSRGFQHPDLLPYTGGAFSDAIDAGLEHEARVLSPEEIKAKRIAELRQQLSALTDEAA